MSQTSILTDQTQSRRWHEMLAAYRRACVLRRQNRHAEAEAQIRELVDPTLATLRASGELEENQIPLALEQEERRVEDAALVAELILPFITAATGTQASTPAKFAEGNSPATARPRPAADNIAAFIDDMFAQSAPPPRR